MKITGFCEYNTWVFFHHCEKDTREFQCKKTYEMYKRMHSKKCKKCRDGPLKSGCHQKLQDQVTVGSKVMRSAGGKFTMTKLKKVNMRLTEDGDYELVPFLESSRKF